MDADDRLHVEAVFRQDLGELRLADGADRRHVGHAVLVGDLAQRPHARLRALDAHVHQFVGEQPAAAAAAERALADRVRRHVEEVVADRAQDRARDFELAARLVAHARGARDVAGIVEGEADVIVLRLVESQPALLDQVVGEFADVLRNRIGGIEEVERPGERVRETVGDAPGVAAFAEHEALDAEILGRLADAQRDLLHVVVASR